MTGTKFGCGIASCGACTVHVDGKAVRSCAMPVGLVEGKAITTIEGLSPDGSQLGRGSARQVHHVPQRKQSGFASAIVGKILNHFRLADFDELRLGLNPLDGRPTVTGVIAGLKLDGQARDIVVASDPVELRHDAI
jgi:hypothetical protein